MRYIQVIKIIQIYAAITLPVKRTYLLFKAFQ